LAFISKGFVMGERGAGCWEGEKNSYGHKGEKGTSLTETKSGGRTLEREKTKRCCGQDKRKHLGGQNAWPNQRREFYYSEKNAKGGNVKNKRGGGFERAVEVFCGGACPKKEKKAIKVWGGEGFDGGKLSKGRGRKRGMGRPKGRDAGGGKATSLANGSKNENVP